jgi:translation initiation factor 3 subunit D
MIRAVNEYDLSNEWRKKIKQNNKGSLISSEIKNQTCKISKWICQANLAGIDNIKLGYISRTNNKDKHGILLVENQNVKYLS